MLNEENISSKNNILIGFQSEPPPFKTPLIDKLILPKNISEIIDLYYNFISDTRTLPLHLLKEINFEPKSNEEKAQKKE